MQSLARPSGHLQGHRATRGCLLRWIVDFAFTIRALDEELSLDDLLATASATTDLVTLFRALGFLQYELNIAPPAELAPAIEFIEPFRLSEVLRSRRLMPWAVRRPRGWLRLLAGAARLRSVPAGYSLPHLDDMLRRPLDVVRERRANHRAIKTLQRLDGS